MKIPFLIGRMVFGGYFLYNGVNHILHRQMLAQYAGSKQVPAPDVAVGASGALMLVGGASILLGFRPKIGAAAIISFLAGVSPVMHDFWRIEDPQQRMGEMVNFTKNMALLGAALALAGVEEPWPVALAVPESGAVERVVDFAKRLAA
jgi:uncharacterized membrane protein YphA (DoxX/SURF4 family)